MAITTVPLVVIGSEAREGTYSFSTATTGVKGTFWSGVYTSTIGLTAVASSASSSVVEITSDDRVLVEADTATWATATGFSDIADTPIVGEITIPVTAIRIRVATALAGTVSLGIRMSDVGAGGDVISGVDSVFTRTGDVVAEADDYTKEQIDGLKETDAPVFAGLVIDATTPGALDAGLIERDTNNFYLNTLVKSPIATSLFSQTNRTTVSNTSSFSNIFENALGEGTLTLPANFFSEGRSIVIKTYGYYGTTGTPTFRYNLDLGATNLLAALNVDLPTGVAASAYYSEQIITCQSVGATGSVQGFGTMTFLTSTGSVKAIPNYNSSATTIDTTAALTISLTVQFGAASNDNFLATTNAFVEVLY